MTPLRHTLVTMSVAGANPAWVEPWLWTVVGGGPTVQGFAPTEGEAWAAARAEARRVTSRLETPAGGHELRHAIEGER